MKLKLTLPLIALSTFSGMLSQLYMTLAIPQVANSAQVVTQEDYLILPKQVGKISRQTTKQDLIRWFGSTNLQDFIAHGAEGEGNYPATRILRGGNRSLEVLWIDDKQKQANIVRVYDSRWHTKEGIQIHTSVVQLQRMFGQFRFFGFEWDYGGNLIVGNRKLDEYRKHYSLDFWIGLPEGRCNHLSQDCQVVIGEQQLSSTNAAVNRLNAEIVFLYVVL
ncbi:MAG: hypothetical protein ACM37W_03990 [Actinomycetota bacterium]